MRNLRHDIAGIVIATAVGVSSALLVAGGIAYLMGWYSHWLNAPWWHMAIQVLRYELPITLIAALAAVIVYRLPPRARIDPECRCRRCGYIFKGLSKPECPECGEVI